MTLFEQVAAIACANHEMARASGLMQQATSRIHELETALNRMVQAHENLVSDTEGKYPTPDAGCIDCTVGTVPDRYNTGPCAYHAALRVLGRK